MNVVMVESIEVFSMEKIKCECGHENPYGTKLCEACGKPLEDEGKSSTLLDMRYDGVARRSQTYNKTIVDKIWNFFSSVKVGVWLIILTLVASSIGTIFPQELYIPNTVDPAEYYREEYGIFGQLYYTLGFHNLYGSWWYMLLVASLGVSIIVASIDRGVPLYRVLKNQRVTRNENFLKRQRLFGQTKTENIDETMEKASSLLKRRKYKIREENGHILAEKGRFSRWGPYVNHTGLIIFLFGAMLRFFPGMYVDDLVWVREGEIEAIPGTGGEYYLENEQFIVDIYDKENTDEVFLDALERTEEPVIKNFQTNAVLYKRVDGGTIGEEPELEKVKTHEIRVNQPLTFDNFSLYQLNYKLNELNKMTFTLDHRETGESVGEIEIDLFQPEEEYDLGNGYRVVIDSYFPNFTFNEEGEPTTISSIPDNPAFIFRMYSPEHPEEGEYSFVGIQRNEDIFKENDYQMSFAGIETKHVTGLTVRKDLTLPFIILGGVIFMIGLIQGSYWSHRRIWLQRIHGEIWAAGYTNKQWESLKRDFQALEEAGIQMPEDRLEEKEKQKEKE